ncbi:hypothetical protein [Trichothermofontia sp.]
MEVLEHSASRLVILDGAMVYSYGNIPSANSLIIQPLIIFTVCTLVVSFFPGASIKLAFILGSITAALPCIGLLLVRIYGGGRYPTYVFDQQVGTLTCSTPAVFPSRPPKVTRYSLNDIVAVKSVTEANDDPPPIYWRKIQLKMRLDIDLELHPGHDEPEKQQEMVTVLRSFLNLD